MTYFSGVRVAFRISGTSSNQSDVPLLHLSKKTIRSSLYSRQFCCLSEMIQRNKQCWKRRTNNSDEEESINGKEFMSDEKLKK